MDDTWFADGPVHLFIDTSCLVSMGFNFSHKGFVTIENGVSAGDLKVISTQILKGEFLKHAAAAIGSDLEKLGHLHAIRSLSADKITEIERVAKEATGQTIWGKFEAMFAPEDISRNVNWQGVFEDYFALRPPFTLKKKDEFPDAFNLKMIEGLNPARLILISSDGDFERWIAGRQNIVLYKKLNEFTDAYLKIRDPAFAAAAITGFRTLKDQILERLKDEYSADHHYSVNCYHSTVQSGEVTDLSVVSHTLTATDHEQEFAVFQVRARGTANLELDCPVVSWDSIDKEEIFHGSNQKTTDVDIDIEATVTIFVNQQDPTDSDFEISDSTIHAAEFDVPDAWVSFLDDAGDEHEQG